MGSIGLGRLLRLGVGAVLVGAIAFGLWHVVVGGLVNGNGNAATFGLALASVSFFLLAGLRAVDRLARPPRDG